MEFLQAISAQIVDIPPGPRVRHNGSDGKHTPGTVGLAKPFDQNFLIIGYDFSDVWLHDGPLVLVRENITAGIIF